jgi:hypothetical protein
VDWIGLAQDRGKWRGLVNAVTNHRDLYNAGILSIGYTIGGPSSSAQLHRASQLVNICCGADGGSESRGSSGNYTRVV